MQEGQEWQKLIKEVKLNTAHRRPETNDSTGKYVTQRQEFDKKIQKGTAKLNQNTIK